MSEKTKFPRVDGYYSRTFVRSGHTTTKEKRYPKPTYQLRPLDGSHRCALAVFKLPSTRGVCLHVRLGMLISLVVDFDPSSADMASGAIWHPHHVLSALCYSSCLGVCFEIEIQLSRLIHLGLRVHDRGFNCTVHD